jgi:hypothetical protein
MRSAPRRATCLRRRESASCAFACRDAASRFFIFFKFVLLNPKEDRDQLALSSVPDRPSSRARQHIQANSATRVCLKNFIPGVVRM